MNKKTTPSIQFIDEVQKLITNIATSENIRNPVLEVSEASAKGDNYLGQLHRVKIEDKLQRKSKTLIVKSAPAAKVLRQTAPVGLYYKREIDAYSKVLPTLYDVQEKHNVPEILRFTHAKYYGSIEEEEKETIILEDLKESGFKMYDRKKPFDLQHLELVIKTLARFHATSFVLKKTDPKRFEELSKLVGNGGDYGENVDVFFKSAKKQGICVMKDPEIKRRADERIGDMYQKLLEYLNPERTEPYNAICHGDCWINNFLFKYQKDRVKQMKFVDLQIIRLASPVTDLAYMIFSCTDEALRSEYYASILDLYYDTLDSNITRMRCKTSECYPIDVFRNQIKSTMPVGLTFSIMLIPIILVDKENVPDMNISPEEFDDSMFEKMLSDASKERINGVARDFVKFGYM